jgi:4-hydroxyphenylacetate 3-monooxygenase
MDTPGLKFICRDSCARPGNIFDHPFSSRFDEQDAFAIFDGVEVPHDRVFIDGNLDVYNSVMTTGWSPNIMQQTMIRAQTKLEFAYGLGTRMSEAINDVSPEAQQMLGEIWTYAEFARSAVRVSEVEAHEYGNGVWFPSRPPLSALRAALPSWFPRVNEIISLIGSHNLLAAPTCAQISDPRLNELVEHYMRGANGFSTSTRSRIFRLASDFAGTALAGRNQLYERFYIGSGARNYQVAHQLASRERAQQLVDRFLKEEMQ